MDYYQFYNERESKIKREVLNLNFTQKLMFCYFCLQRNVENYYHLSLREKLADPFFLKKVGNDIWDLITSPGFSDAKTEELMYKIMTDSGVPDTEDSSNASWIIDACSIAYKVLEYLNTKHDSHITYISLLSIETVEKWIYEREGYIEDNDPNFSEKLLSNSLMRDEIRAQDYILKEIASSNDNSDLFRLIEKEIKSLKETNLGFPTG